MSTFGRRLHLVAAPPAPGEGPTAPAPPPDLMPPGAAPPGLAAAAAPYTPAPASPPEPAAAAASTGAGSVPLQRLRAQVLERIDAVIAGSLPAEQLRAQIGAIVHELADRDRLQ